MERGRKALRRIPGGVAPIPFFHQPMETVSTWIGAGGAYMAPPLPGFHAVRAGVPARVGESW